MKIFETERDPLSDVLAALAPQVTGPDTEVAKTVSEIIADVRARGDEAVLELGRRYDAPELAELRVTEAEFDEAYREIKPELLQALRTAKTNIDQFHRRQFRNSWMEMNDDFTYGQIVRPIEAVGIYAPARMAPLPSSVLMTAIPGMVAGVKRLVLCAPPQKDGAIHGPMLVAARECGVSEVYKASGAQAAAAMAFGTHTILRVDKIVGPGNVYFNEGKRQVFGVVGIDQIAGPSEILVLADDSANPAYIAADILSQAEHAHDSRCVLVTGSRKLASSVLIELKSQTARAERRDLIRQSLDGFGVVVIARDLDECIELANAFAPEHLEILLAQPWEALPRIRNAGAIMVGHYTPVPLCDFAAGPNHTLPTGAAARFGSALSVDDFVKKSGLLSYTREALENIAPTVLEMAAAEGLDAHANTLRIRLTNNAG